MIDGSHQAPVVKRKKVSKVSVNTNDDLFSCQMGKSCEMVLEGDEYLQFLVDSPDADGEMYSPGMCSASHVMKNFVGGALAGFLLWHLMIYLLINIIVIWRMKKPIIKYLLGIIFLTLLGIGFADSLVPGLSCGMDWQGYWSCKGLFDRQVATLLSKGYLAAWAFILTYGAVVSLIIYIMILVYTVRMFIRSIVWGVGFLILLNMIGFIETRGVAIYNPYDNQQAILRKTTCPNNQQFRIAISQVMIGYMLILVFIYFCIVLGRFYRYRGLYQ